MPLVVVGLNHRSAPVDVRERFAFPEGCVATALGSLRGQGVGEAVILSTCNRVEIYAAGESDLPKLAQAVRRFLVTDRGFGPDPGNALYAHADQAAIQHLFRVASGLDSLVLGETEILGQLKKAYDGALQAGVTGKVLNKAFQKAFAVAKQIRTETSIQRGHTSVASVAVDLAERIFDDLAEREVLVIGAGDTSEKTARALLSRGARSVMVSNRTFDRAAALAQELGGRAIRFDDWESEFVRIDILVTATGAPHHILDRARLERLLRARGHRPLLLIDLAVPRDIDPMVAMLDDVFLANVDDLQAVADDSARQRREELVRCEQLIREKSAAVFGPISFGSLRPLRGT
jgi:glutamyl-tRNA reductase